MRVLRGRTVFLSALAAAALSALSAFELAAVASSRAEHELERRAEAEVAPVRPQLATALDTGRPQDARRALEGVARELRLAGAALCGTGDAPLAHVPSYLPASCRGEGAAGDETFLVSLAVPRAAGPPGRAILAWDRRAAGLQATELRNLSAAVWAAVVAACVFALWIRALARRRAAAGAARDRPPARRTSLLARGRAWARWRPRPRARPHARWNADELKATLRGRMSGDRIVVVANREPYSHERGADGRPRAVRPASGLVTALEPVLQACSGTWIGHGSGPADRDTVDRHDRIRVPEESPRYAIRRIWLSPEEERGYYLGFSNEALWPLCHQADTRPIFRAADFEHYEAVNRRFAAAAVEEAEGDDPIILVQDYHLALVPALVRRALPNAVILSFWHVPWPTPERFAICPWRDALLDGLLGSSIAGFHTPAHARNFLDTVDRCLEARLDREEGAVVRGARRTVVRSYPISIAWPDGVAELSASPEECRRAVQRELDLPADCLIGVGVDRLDYTKGIEERLLAVERLLETEPALRGRFVFVQAAAPSRSAIPAYRALADTVGRVSERVNQRFGAGGYRPIVLLQANHAPQEVYRLYRAADLCYVSSLDDGMNLVAKEFVAARTDERGVLVLSRFAGAARELAHALIVNPYDVAEAAKALATALRMGHREQAARMRAMREHVAEHNVYRWAGRMLEDAASLRHGVRTTRRLERLAGRARAAPADPP